MVLKKKTSKHDYDHTMSFPPSTILEVLLDACTNMLPTLPSFLDLYTIQLNVREFQSSKTPTLS
jgi:hypothetical protein